MYTITRLDHNHTYHGPTDDIGDLSCRVEGNITASHWRPTEQELSLLVEGGGCVELEIFGHPIPPVRLTVVPADQPEAPAEFKRPREQSG